MVDEARKTNAVRGDGFNRRNFSGSVIDVGCGPDLVVPHAVPFDIEDGDAQWLRRYFEPETFDCVHSSHCLEHMPDPGLAVSQWWGLVKPGGHLIVVVPDEDLYEQGIWPSLFNPDHKATFNLGKQQPSWSPVSYDVGRLIAALPQAELIDARIHDTLYNRSLICRDSRRGLRLYRLGLARDRIMSRLMRVGLPAYRLNNLLDRLEVRAGKPVDQTLGPAMAQIQIVARKSPSMA
jgi:SAM-dependent methyltransferase